jgi:hypothetical protein
MTMFIQLQKESERIRREEEAEEKEAERQRQEHLHKNKEYFDLNKAFLEIRAKGDPIYYGENTGAFGAWTPHGYGTMKVNGLVEYDGQYTNGKRDGMGLVVWADGSKWEGEFVNGNAHGSGYFTPSRTYVNPAQAKPKRGILAGGNNTDKTLKPKARTMSVLEDESNQYGLLSFNLVPVTDVKSAGTERVRKGKQEEPDLAFEPMEALMKNNSVVCFKSGIIFSYNKW